MSSEKKKWSCNPLSGRRIPCFTCVGHFKRENLASTRIREQKWFSTSSNVKLGVSALWSLHTFSTNRTLQRQSSDREEAESVNTLLFRHLRFTFSMALPHSASKTQRCSDNGGRYERPSRTVRCQDISGPPSVRKIVQWDVMTVHIPAWCAGPTQVCAFVSWASETKPCSTLPVKQVAVQTGADPTECLHLRFFEYLIVDSVVLFRSPRSVHHLTDTRCICSCLATHVQVTSRRKCRKCFGDQSHGLVVPSHTKSSCGTSYCAMFDDCAVIVIVQRRRVQSRT